MYRDCIYWLERRPAEAGRSVIVSADDGRVSDVLPKGYNARSRVHEYGGGVYCVTGDGVFFVNDADQDIYLVRTGADPQRISHTGSATRFADLCYDPLRKRILCVCEHHGETGAEADNSLVAINATTGLVTTLVHGSDFYASPRISPDGSRLAWLCWNHPNMPWDGTELWIAAISDSGKPERRQHVAGDNRTSVFQPEWSPDNRLYFVHDASGWWNLARIDDEGLTAVTDRRSEFGLPQWVFGQTTYAFCGSHSICCTHIEGGSTKLSLLDLQTSELTEPDLGLDVFSSVCASENTIGVIAASATCFPQVMTVDAASLTSAVIARSCSAEIDTGYISTGAHIAFDTRHHDKAYAYYYPPANRDYAVPENELPPLIVICHGGPTGATDKALDLRKQYWTSRGFAMLDVNYSGSTGYGRAYRDRLARNWGIRDVEDVCDGATALADQHIVDRNRLIIKGSSAGGYTVLSALTFQDVFAGGASYYGISDLESLLADTHKFEAHYTDSLVGDYPAHKQEYYDRSPINFVDRLSCPVIFFQGAEDRVVPPSQAETMVKALKNKGIAVAYIAFEKEQHGFRRASTIKAALEAELYFYSVLFGFEPADDLPPIAIDNIDVQ